MHAYTFADTKAAEFEQIPCFSASQFHAEMSAMLERGLRCLAFFALPKSPGMAGALIAVFTNDLGDLLALRSEPLKAYESLSPHFAQVELYEREIYEQWGIVPEGHPWLKPVRISPDSPGHPYEFFRVDGDAIHEVGVGPVHAGIIEPGHFRFQCYGEIVLSLEIALGYQHRGLEKLLLPYGPKIPVNERGLRLVECAAGDSSVAMASARCVLLERLLGEQVAIIPERAQRIRRIALELERLANHCGDLGAIAGDCGFLPTSSWNGRIRGDFLNLTAQICGNRFGRELVALGGCAKDLSPDEAAEIKKRLLAAGEDTFGAIETMFGSGLMLERFSQTGKLSKEEARQLGLVGVAARACGIVQDVRFSAPLADLPDYGSEPRTATSGDVLARAQVRRDEMHDSMNLIHGDLDWICAQGDNKTEEAAQKLRLENGSLSLKPGLLALAQVEAWRGELCHLAVTGKSGELLCYKIYEPSFHNWRGLAQAMRNGQISDFPLCNKSFNLSYCGYDL